MSPVMFRGKPAYGPVGGAVDTVKAAHELITRCGQWPYPWVYPPSGSTPLAMRGSIALPALNTETEVCSFNVPVGKVGYLDALLLTINDSNYIEGLGMANWAVDLNQPAGSTFAIGRPVDGYGFIDTQYGSIAHGAVKLPYGYLLGENDTLRIKITLPDPILTGGANPLTVGYPATTTCWGLGWIWPVIDRR